ncbi:hypothetical protein DXA21_01205 [Parabacteroides distasonis]|nr:hypothetical protein DXA21_01205 [Parabacteroides distasonis]
MFMFGLQESSKLNRTNFGVYLEDILISMLYGEQVDQPFCHATMILGMLRGKIRHKTKNQIKNIFVKYHLFVTA